MKRKINLFSYSLIILLLSSIVIFYSCKKTSDSEIGGDSIEFVVNVSGIEAPIENITSLASNSVFLSAPVQEEPVYEETIEGKISFGFAGATENIVTKIDAIKKIGNKSAALSNMGAGIKYMVLLISRANGKIEFMEQATVGVKLEIPAYRGAAYDLVAYSYNTTDNIVKPDRNNPVIQTPDDKPLIYAEERNTTTTVSNKQISLIFRHKLTELAFEIDTDRLFAAVNIADVNVEFVGNYINVGSFDIKTGQISNVGTNYKKPITLVEHENETGKRNVKISRYYVANASALTTYSVKVSSLKATFTDGVKRAVVSSPRDAIFNFATPPAFNATGKRLLGVVKLWYIFPTKKILHVTRINYKWNYAAESSELGGEPAAPHHLLKATLNFGNSQNSVVRMGGFTHERCINDATSPVSTRKTIEYFLNRPLADKPDIVIISVYYRMTSDDVTAIIQFLDHGGVVLLMTDGVNFEDMYSQVPFMRRLFNNNNIVLARNGAGGGSLYKFLNINDEILNGAFGNIIEKHWGEDASETTSLSNMPLSEITYYSAAIPNNYTGTITGELTMFKHKTKHLFWIGDGGFLSNERPMGVWVDNTIEPFATINNSQNASATGIGKNPFPNTPGTRTHDNYPIPKLYGYGGGNPNIPSGSTYVYNSTLFANVMSWGILQSEFNGIRTGYRPIVSTDRPEDTSRGNAGF